MKKATIYDVAREAGVSIAAVSQVINGKGKISEVRRREISQIMERLNYRPSVIAAALTGKHTYTIGLLIPDIANPFFAEMARAIEDHGGRSGYSLVICSTDNKDDKIERYLPLLLQKSVDAIIIGTGLDNSDILLPLLLKSIPIVLIARDIPHLDLHTIIVDDYAGGRMAAEHLLQLGHRRLSIIAEDMKGLSSSERTRGVRDALHAAGLELPGAMIKASRNDSLNEVKQTALELLELPEPPTAIFCCNDLLAIGALQAAKELGLKVPEQLSIIGFDNTILTEVTEPALTTIAQPIELMGRLTIELVIAMLGKEEPAAKRTVLQPKLVIRKSTAQAP
jgi:LacI family transcriptional regulator